MTGTITTIPGQWEVVANFGFILMIAGSAILLPSMLAHPSSNIAGCLRKPVWVPVHIGETLAHGFFGLGLIALLPALSLGPIATMFGLAYTAGLFISSLFIACQAFVFPMVAASQTEEYTFMGMVNSGLLDKGILGLMYASAPLMMVGGIGFAICLLLSHGIGFAPGWLLLAAILIIGVLNVVKGNVERATGVLYALVMGVAMIWLARTAVIL